MTRIYTRTGDAGQTGLLGGGRVPKSDPRVAAYGDVDELNAVIGWAATQASEPLRRRLDSIQPDLFAIGAHLASPPPRPGRRRPALPPAPATGRVAELERWIDEAEAELPELRAFIMPGGSPAGAALHLARTVCRRAERAIVALAAADPVEPGILVYVNRLSDLLFVLARLENRRSGAAEVPWSPGRES